MVSKEVNMKLVQMDKHRHQNSSTGLNLKMTHDAFQTLIDLYLCSFCYVLLFSGYNFLSRGPLHWSVDVRNQAVTSGMAMLQGTKLYHGITGQKRQSGLVMDHTFD